MKFSIFQSPLKTWQGNSLILGIFEEDIFPQLEKFDLNFDAKLLSIRLFEKDFKGKKGQLLNLEFLDSEIKSLLIVGLGKRSNINYDSLSNSIADCARRISDREEKSSIFLPWEQLENFSIYSVAEIVRLSIFRDNRFNHKKMREYLLKNSNFLESMIQKKFHFKRFKISVQG